MTFPSDPPSDRTLQAAGNQDRRIRTLAAAELRAALGGARGQIIDTGSFPPPPPAPTGT